MNVLLTETNVSYGLFYQNKVFMIFGDAKESINIMIKLLRRDFVE